MKTSYSENYSPHKLLLRVAIIVFETVQCYSNMSSGSHAQQLLIVSLELCICSTHTLRIIILLYNIIQVCCTEDYCTCTLYVVVQVCTKHCVSDCRQTKQATSCGIVNSTSFCIHIILNHSAAIYM